jgi:translation initiation factor 1
MQTPRRKIELASAGSTLGQNPFATLDLAHLPAGPKEISEPIAAAENQADWPWRGEVLLRRETSHRNGKAVIVLYQLPPHLTAEDLAELARLAKIRCGCGGTLRQREIELQGDHPERLREFLIGLGFRVRGL